MRYPRDGRTEERDDGEDGGLSPPPSCADPKKNKRQVDGPGDERDGNAAVAQPAGAVFNESPDAAYDDSCRDEGEAGPERFRDQLIESSERRKNPVDGLRAFALELALLDEISGG